MCRWWRMEEGYFTDARQPVIESICRKYELVREYDSAILKIIRWLSTALLPAGNLLPRANVHTCMHTMHTRQEGVVLELVLYGYMKL